MTLIRAISNRKAPWGFAILYGASALDQPARNQPKYHVFCTDGLRRWVRRSAFTIESTLGANQSRHDELTEDRVRRRTLHRHTTMISRYRSDADTVAESKLRRLVPLHLAIPELASIEPTGCVVEAPALVPPEDEMPWQRWMMAAP